MAKSIKKFFGTLPGYFKSVLGIMSGIAVLLPPILDQVHPDLIPPQPGTVVAITSGICAFAVFVCIYACSEWPKPRQRTLALTAVVIGSLGFIGWMASNRALVVSPSPAVRLVAGFSLTDDVTQALASGDVDVAPSDALGLLNAFGWESSELIWSDVWLAELMVFFTFLLAFLGAAVCMAGFALVDRHAPAAAAAGD